LEDGQPDTLLSEWQSCKGVVHHCRPCGILAFCITHNIKPRPRRARLPKRHRLCRRCCFASVVCVCLCLHTERQKMRQNATAVMRAAKGKDASEVPLCELSPELTALPEAQEARWCANVSTIALRSPSLSHHASLSGCCDGPPRLANTVPDLSNASSASEPLLQILL